MAGDLLSGLGGLGGLMKGLSGFLPQDDPQVKLMTAQSQVSELKQQEAELYAEIGRLAFQQNPGAYPAQADKLRLVQANLADAQSQLDQTSHDKQAAEQAAKDAEAALTCPNCGTVNPEGTKFCQDCGTKLGATKAVCSSCGAENPPGTKFCGGCGARLEA